MRKNHGRLEKQTVTGSVLGTLEIFRRANQLKNVHSHRTKKQDNGMVSGVSCLQVKISIVWAQNGATTRLDRQ